MQETPFKWTCPYCNNPTTINSTDCDNKIFHPAFSQKYSLILSIIDFIKCPNPECNNLYLSVSLHEAERGRNDFIPGKLINKWQLMPVSNAKKFPDYIPQQVLNDYEEACQIVSISPKASATLSRRCIQGMIRNFWNISRDTLFQEINAIEEKVDPLTWSAIQSVRKIGNIGAHMEKDINLIIDVEPLEAQLLIELIEILIKDWYINKHEREKRLEAIINIEKEKESLKKSKEEL